MAQDAIPQIRFAKLVYRQLGFIAISWMSTHAGIQRRQELARDIHGPLLPVVGRRDLLDNMRRRLLESVQRQIESDALEEGDAISRAVCRGLPFCCQGSSGRFQVEMTYNNPMRRRRTNATSDSLESLLNIHHQTTWDGRRVDPLPVLVEHLQSARVVLRQEREETGGILVRADSLRVGRGGRVFDEFQPIHAALERVEGGRAEGERFGDVVDEFDGQPGQLGYVLVDRLLDVGMARILYLGQRGIPSIDTHSE